LPEAPGRRFPSALLAKVKKRKILLKRLI